MREIVSPLMGLRSPFGGRIDAYKAGGFRPPFVADFSTGYYRTDSARTTFADTITHARAGGATMTDSDGVLKWAPHNLALNSATPATQSITVVSGADYTVECTGVSIALSGAGTGTVTEGSPVEFTASTTTLTLTVTGSTGTMWAYRSDLGGMVNNPDTGDSYVPTTSAAVYLPRRGHHVWNGSAWVDEGILHESEARTNLLTASTPNATDWLESSATLSDGGSSSGFSVATLSTTNASGNVSKVASANNLDTYIFWAIIEEGTNSDFSLRTGLSGNYVEVAFDLSTETYSVPTESGTGSHVATYLERYSDTAYIVGVAASTIGSGTGANNVIYGGSSSGNIDILHTQFELGYEPSSAIPTAGSTATRAAETLTIPAANLPWPSPVVIGEELVTNGTFDADSDWTKGTGWTISGGKLNGTATGGVVETVTQSLPTVIGKVYTIAFNVDAISGNDVLLNVGTSSLGTVSVLTSGAKTYTFTSTANNEILQFRFSGSATAGDTITIDNVSVREIDPLAVSIAMEGRMTYADEGSVDVRFIQWQLNADNRIIIQEVNTGGDIQFVQEADNVFTSVASSNSTPPGVLVPYNIASRHGSTFINGAVDGVALTADTTPVALPDLSATDLNLGHDLMGTIKTFRIWDKDIGDTGIAGAST